MDNLASRPTAAFQPVPETEFYPAGRLAYREAMARLAGPVSIVTSDGAAGLAGCTATAVTSVSDDPPILLVCINRASRNNATIRTNGRLCVNVLGASQEALARTFANGELSISERFAAARCLDRAAGSPALEDATANLDCDILKIEEVGSHSVFFCTVRHVRIAGNPSGLIYLGRTFHSLATNQT